MRNREILASFYASLDVGRVCPCMSSERNAKAVTHYAREVWILLE